MAGDTLAARACAEGVFGSSPWSRRFIRWADVASIDFGMRRVGKREVRLLRLRNFGGKSIIVVPIMAIDGGEAAVAAWVEAVEALRPR